MYGFVHQTYTNVIYVYIFLHVIYFCTLQGGSRADVTDWTPARKKLGVQDGRGRVWDRRRWRRRVAGLRRMAEDGGGPSKIGVWAGRGVAAVRRQRMALTASSA